MGEQQNNFIFLEHIFCNICYTICLVFYKMSYWCLNPLKTRNNVFYVFLGVDDNEDDEVQHTNTNIFKYSVDDSNISVVTVLKLNVLVKRKQGHEYAIQDHGWRWS